MLVNVQVAEEVQFWGCFLMVLLAVDQDQLDLVVGGGQDYSFGLGDKIRLNNLYHEVVVVKQYQEVHWLPDHKL